MDAQPNFFKSLVKISGKVLFVMGLLLNILMIFFGFFPSLIYVLIMLSGAGMVAFSKDFETPEYVSTDNTNWFKKSANTVQSTIQNTDTRSVQHGIKKVFFIVLIVLVTAISIIVLGENYFNKRDTISACNEITSALNHYKESKKVYPGTLAELSVDNPMLSDISKDKWGHLYQYKTGQNGTAFTLTSAGEDGKFNTGDDLVFRN